MKKRYLVTLAYEVIIDADDEESAIASAREDIERLRRLGADFDLTFADEFEDV